MAEESNNLITEEDMANAEDASTMTLPSRAETAESEEQDDKADSGNAESDNVEGETSEEDDKPSDDAVATVTDEPQDAPQLLEDPGEYHPADYSFDVTVYDSEGKNPKTLTVSSVEEWDKLLESEPNLGNAAALMKAQRLATKMETSLDRDRRDYEATKKAYDEEQAVIEASNQTMNQWLAELSYLQNKGELPQVPKEYVNAEWTPDLIAKVPAIKAQTDLLTYMRDENTARQKAGLSPMTSVLDAYNAYQLEQSRKQAADSKHRQAQVRKEAGARVAGSSPAPMTTAPKGIAVGRVLDMNSL